MLKLGEAANPLLATLMNGFMEKWSQRADRVPDTTGSLYAPPPGASGIGGGQRRPGERKTALALGAAALAVAVGMGLARRRS
ncbi:MULTISPECIES: hypothetical protein [unclassified Massilia]|uniref:hypothetical protein n=1 Tax=unclassified Massilia TaxID=2609279 RepID=UPI00191D44D5|nr:MULTISPECIES: hypothetical protein [unclassified Massilia]